MAQLDPTAQDQRQAGDAWLALLASPAGHGDAGELVGRVIQLAPTAKAKRQACEALLGMLAGQTNGYTAEGLVGGLAQLDPTVHDLRAWRSWTVLPTEELLGAVRRNSALGDWLAVLPSLTALSGSHS